uniref:Uncharacterized protein n=1 Tax=Mycena chlorophos TaxID=658473 RepID=A0ABQ0LGN9_MYCCL|nr:predicted protein [Mycena chlorophos]
MQACLLRSSLPLATPPLCSPSERLPSRFRFPGFNFKVVRKTHSPTDPDQLGSTGRQNIGMQPTQPTITMQAQLASRYTANPVAMFNNCENITITGGTFIQYNRRLPRRSFRRTPDEDYHRIRLGDINLLKLVYEGENRATYRKGHHGQLTSKKTTVKATQKVYLAKVFPSSEIFTVMTYDDNVPEISFRGNKLGNPGILQLFGITSSNRLGFHALVYNSGLIPIMQLIKLAPTYLIRELLKLTLAQKQQVFSHHLAVHFST